MNYFITSKIFRNACFALLFILSIIFKLYLINIGAPYTTIDDYTLFNAGFLVWFGQAPPQRMYFESWLVGAASIFTYIQHLVSSGHLNQLGLNIIADAYRDFTLDAKKYVLNYRLLMLAFDLLTAWLVYLLANSIFSSQKKWAAILAAGLYLFSYNTIWCNLVARPDTMTAFFAVLGMYLYYKSNLSEHKFYFYLSAIALGCATGFKLHAAFFVIAICIDLMRIYGLRTAIASIINFGAISVFIFVVTAGTPLFDPLLYVKLRMLNIQDDASPWLHWGDQFVTLLRGTGWAIIPLILSGVGLHFLNKKITIPANVKSVFFIGLLFVLFFASIRQLRAYWMLPALPLFYVMAAYIISELKQKVLAQLASAALLAIFITQSFLQLKDFSHAEYGQLQSWVKKNIAPSDTIYIVGYDTLFLPRNSVCLQNHKKMLVTAQNESNQQGESFTMRHIRLWEENTALTLIDMLNATSDIGFNYYSTNDTPFSKLNTILNISDIKYLLIAPDYKPEESAKEIEALKSQFTLVTTVNAPGGKAGTGGLPYDIYVRNF